MKSQDHSIDFSLVTIADSISEQGELLPSSVTPPGLETLSAWFRCLIELQHVTESIPHYFELVASAVCEPGGLDGALVILASDPVSCEDAGVSETASMQYYAAAGTDQQSGTESELVQQHLIQRVIREDATVYHSATELNRTGQPSFGQTVAVAPIRSETSRIIGFLYAWRETNDDNHRVGVRDLEAHFVHLVAQTTSTTLQRHQREKVIANQQAMLSQAFPAKVLEQLAYDPGLFEGREQVVTTLFADLREFSAISNRLPTRQTYAMINEIMDQWTEYVMDCSGAVVDYFGDGLVAFWNAPLEVANHAAMAIRCAQKINQSLHSITETWGPILKCPVRAGVGISTGMAQVGNCGSRHRVKYGPHGPAVNLAARLEKLTKEFGVPIVMSSESARQSESDFLSRRIGRATVQGFDLPVDLFEPIYDLERYSFSYLQDFEEVLQATESLPPEQVRSRLDILCRSNPGDPVASRLLKLANDQLPKSNENLKPKTRDESDLW